MKKRIALVCGGDSSEAEISVDGAKFLLANLDSELYLPHLVKISKKEWVVLCEDGEKAIDKNDFSYIDNGTKQLFDYAYINIHGTPGENGILQSYFELISLPYSSSGVDSSAMSFNKYFCKSVAASTGVAEAKDMILYSGQPYCKEEIVENLGLPIFVKPNASGSSFGVSKVCSIEEIDRAVEAALKESDVVLIEEAIVGREFAQGIATLNGVLTLLPLTEVISKRDFFDYEAKYQGLSDEITPANVEDDVAKKIGEMTKKIYQICRCRGVARIDFIVKDKEPYLIEINSVPGMGSSSLIPQQVAAMGMKMSDFLTGVINSTW